MHDWSEADQHAKRAHRFFEAGQWERALAELDLALACDPTQSDWHFGRALTLEALARFKEAAEALEHVLTLRPADAEALLNLGVNRLRLDAPRRAIDAFDRLAQVEPERLDAYTHRIHAYTALGEHDQAEVMFYLALQIDDRCAQCYDLMARSLVLRGDEERALWCWHKTQQLDPTFPDVYAHLAKLHWRRGQLGRARDLMLCQVREQPGDTQTLVALGELLVQMNRRAEAGEKLRRALELDPTLADAHALLGALALSAGHPDAAADRYHRARQLEPGRPGPGLGLARIAAIRGQRAEARRLLDAELRLDDQPDDQCIESARLLVELGDPARAAGLLDPLLEPALDTDSPPADTPKLLRARAHLCRGVARLQVGQASTGLHDCRLAHRLDPELQPALHNLVLAYLHLGRTRRARACLRRLQRLTPGDPDAARLADRVRHHRLTTLLRRPARALRRRLGRA